MCVCENLQVELLHKSSNSSNALSSKPKILLGQRHETRYGFTSLAATWLPSFPGNWLVSGLQLSEFVAQMAAAIVKLHGMNGGHPTIIRNSTINVIMWILHPIDILHNYLGKLQYFTNLK